MTCGSGAFGLKGSAPIHRATKTKEMNSEPRTAAGADTWHGPRSQHLAKDFG